MEQRNRDGTMMERFNIMLSLNKKHIVLLFYFKKKKDIKERMK